MLNETMLGDTVVSVTVAVVFVIVAVEMMGVTLVSMTVAAVSVTDAVDMPSKGQEPIEPFASRFITKKSLSSLPEGTRYPLQQYTLQHQSVEQPVRIPRLFLHIFSAT